MKKIKIGLSVIALFFAVVLSSFALVDEKQDQTQFWYDFVGVSETNPEHYELSSVQTDSYCHPEPAEMCRVKALPHQSIDDAPDLSDPNIINRYLD